LQKLGAEGRVNSDAAALNIWISAPPSRMAATLDELARALGTSKFSEASFDAAKKAILAGWVNSARPDWYFSWTALGLSAAKSRYRYLSTAAVEKALSALKIADLEKLLHQMSTQTAAINIVGPFDAATARGLAASLAGRSSARAPVHQPPPAKVSFRPGVYVLDGGSAEAVEGCVLWPLAAWGTPDHAPALLMPWFFRDDIADGLNARFAEHGAREPYWQSNTLLTQDGDFLRYSLRAPVAQVAPILESLRVHLARLGNGEFEQIELERAHHDELQFHIQQSTTLGGWMDSLYRASAHDTDATAGIELALMADRVSAQTFAAFAKGLLLEHATIAFLGPAKALTEALDRIGLGPVVVTAADPSPGVPSAVSP
jgi:predicted Zn-dependent peptidase